MQTSCNSQVYILIRRLKHRRAPGGEDSRGGIPSQAVSASRGSPSGGASGLNVLWLRIALLDTQVLVQHDPGKEKLP